MPWDCYRLGRQLVVQRWHLRGVCTHTASSKLGCALRRFKSACTGGTSGCAWRLHVQSGRSECVTLEAPWWGRYGRYAGSLPMQKHLWAIESHTVDDVHRALRPVKASPTLTGDAFGWCCLRAGAADVFPPCVLAGGWAIAVVVMTGVGVGGVLGWVCGCVCGGWGGVGGHEGSGAATVMSVVAR